MKILPITPLKATQTNNIGFFGKKSVLNLSKDMTDLSFYASSEPIEQRHYAFNIPDDKFVEFQIDKSTLENLLSVNNQPNEVLVTKFVLTYKDLALSKNEQYKRELAYYSDLYKRKELTEISKPILSAQEVEEIYAEEFSYPHKDELSMLRGYISKLYGPSMLAEILDVESAIRDWQKNIYSDSYDATTRIFQMCKHPYYMEFKDMDKKALAVDKIEQYIRHTSDKYIDNEQVDKVYSEILSAALNNDGSYDYELINEAINTIISRGRNVSCAHVMNSMKTFIRKDPNNRPLILDVMKDLNYSAFAIDINNDNFERVMSLCFTNGRFDPIKAEAIVILNNQITTWVANQIREFQAQGKSPEQVKEKVESDIEKAFQVIQDYSRFSSDENGEFNPLKSI